MHIRNFCIIAHIDHGKSTLADRLLERTGAITEREQWKPRSSTTWTSNANAASPSRPPPSPSPTRHPDTGESYIYNLIDTPGHVDFHYEVAKALQACEGAILLVRCHARRAGPDRRQRLRRHRRRISKSSPSSTRSTCPRAQPDAVAEEMEQVLGIDALACDPRSPRKPARASTNFSSSSPKDSRPHRLTPTPRCSA